MTAPVTPIRADLPDPQLLATIDAAIEGLTAQVSGLRMVRLGLTNGKLGNAEATGLLFRMLDAGKPA